MTMFRQAGWLPGRITLDGNEGNACQFSRHFFFFSQACATAVNVEQQVIQTKLQYVVVSFQINPEDTFSAGYLFSGIKNHCK